MQRSFNERISSHWVRGCFGEDWQESFRQRDLKKYSAATGVFCHDQIIKHQPLRNEWDVRNQTRLRQKFVWDRKFDLEVAREALIRADLRRAVKPKYRVSKLEGIDLNKVKSAVAKYATGPEAYTCHYRPLQLTPEEQEKRNKKQREYYHRTRKEKGLAAVTSWRKKLDPYAPLADHLEEYLQGQAKEKNLPEPEVIASTKELIEQRFGEFKAQAKDMIEINDAEVWRLKMYEALEALLKSGRVHEFIN